MLKQYYVLVERSIGSDFLVPVPNKMRALELAHRLIVKQHDHEATYPISPWNLVLSSDDKIILGTSQDFKFTLLSTVPQTKHIIMKETDIVYFLKCQDYEIDQTLTQ